MTPHRRRTLTLALVLSTVVAVPALATDQPLSGRRLTVRRTKTGVRLSLTSTDTSTDGALFPTAGSAGDLATTGVTIDVITTGEGTASAAIPPGASGWKHATKSYRFTNPAAPAGVSAVHAFKLRKGKGLTLDLRAAGLPLAVPLGSVAVRIAYGGGERVCMLFAGGSVRKDVAGRFLAADASRAGIASCNASDLGGPLVCGNGDVEAGEQCDGSVSPACFFPGGSCGAPGTPAACQCCVVTGGQCGVNGHVGGPCCDPAAVCQFQLSPEIPGFCTIPPPPFPGCDATGTWRGDPITGGFYFIVESAGGALSLVSVESQDLLTYEVRDGSRVGPEIYVGGTHTGTQISCTGILTDPLYYLGLSRVSASTCGDGVLDDASAYGIAEECDDGNHIAGDCCSPTCRIEPGCP